MLELIVLGHIPGTHIYLSFSGVLLLSLLLATLLLVILDFQFIRTFCTLWLIRCQLRFRKYQPPTRFSP